MAVLRDEVRAETRHMTRAKPRDEDEAHQILDSDDVRDLVDLLSDT